MFQTLLLRRITLLASLLLLNIVCQAQPNESFMFNRNAVSVNLTPGINREIQLFYERTLSPLIGIGVMAGTRIPSPTDSYVATVSIFSVGDYSERVYALPYENGVATSIHVRMNFVKDRPGGFIPFVSPGLIYRYNFFNNKCFGESAMSFYESWVQRFSLRKHEINARVLFGFRSQFRLSSRGSAVALEFSNGIGMAARRGKFDVSRRLPGSSHCGSLEQPEAERPSTHEFSAGTLVFPVNFKIGYSWGR